MSGRTARLPRLCVAAAVVLGVVAMERGCVAPHARPGPSPVGPSPSPDGGPSGVLAPGRDVVVPKTGPAHVERSAADPAATLVAALAKAEPPLSTSDRRLLDVLVLQALDRLGRSDEVASEIAALLDRQAWILRPELVRWCMARATPSVAVARFLLDAPRTLLDLEAVGLDEATRVQLRSRIGARTSCGLTGGGTGADVAALVAAALRHGGDMVVAVRDIPGGARAHLRPSTGVARGHERDRRSNVESPDLAPDVEAATRRIREKDAIPGR
jgi:hypothetical protein